MSPFNSPYLTQNYHSKYVEIPLVKHTGQINDYKIRNFLTSGFELYAIWVECLGNKLSQIPEVNIGFIRHIVAHIR